MSTAILVRHGLTPATGVTLAGRAPGIDLDDRGREQAKHVAERLSGVTLAAIVTSPLERCVQTAEAIRDARPEAPEWHVDERFIECGYGEWTGRPLSELVTEPLWPTVLRQPSAARFPGGESLAEVSARAVAAVREWDARLGDATWVLCSHGDVLKAILADALGLHLDLFQRISVDPAAVSVVRYGSERPHVLRVNDSGSPLESLAARPQTAADAVGGGAATA